MIWLKLLSLLVIINCVQTIDFCSEVDLEDSLDHEHWVKFNCSDGQNLALIVKIYKKKKISVECQDNESDWRVFDLLPNLNQTIEGIYIAYCPLLKRFSLITAKYPSIQKVFLDLMDVPKIESDYFSEKSDIRELHLRGNLESLDLRMFENLKLLERIYLLDNNFTELPANLFEHNHLLKEVLIQMNQHSLSFGNGLLVNMKHLSIVAMSSNNIYNLGFGAFTNSVNIEEIDLSWNKLTDIDL